MKQLNANTTLNIEFKDLELLSKLNQFASELSIPLEDFIKIALEKLLNDIQFIRDLRNFAQKKVES